MCLRNSCCRLQDCCTGCENLLPQKCHLCVLCGFVHYACGLWFVVAEISMITVWRSWVNLWQYSSLSITLNDSSYFFLSFSGITVKIKKTNGMAISSHYQLLSKCKKTLKIATGSNDFYDKLQGCLFSVLTNRFLIKDKQFLKLHLFCCTRNRKLLFPEGCCTL